MLNRIVWNRTVFDLEIVLTLHWIVWNRTVLTFKFVQTKKKPQKTGTKLNCLK